MVNLISCIRRGARILWLWLPLLGLAAGFTSQVHAAYPERSIRVIVPFPAGGPTDAVARVISQQLAEVLGQPVVVDNRGGAGGLIATEAAAAAPADGYTLFFATTGALTINPALYRNFKLDIAKAFEPVGAVGGTSNVLVVSPALSVQNIAELISLARQKPGTLTFGSAGNGSSNHLSGEMLKTTTGINIVHVPYKGSAAALLDVVAGRVSMMFDVPLSVSQHVAAGRLRPLVTTGPRRSPILPLVLTGAEAGIPNFEVIAWFGVVAPRGTPAEAITRLNAALQKAVASDAVRKQFDTMGVEAMTGTAQAFGALIASDTAKWAKVVKDSGATID